MNGSRIRPPETEKGLPQIHAAVPDMDRKIRIRIHTPRSIMASATFRKPAILAPMT